MVNLMSIQYPGADVREQKQFNREYFQYQILPYWWIPVNFSRSEIVQTIARLNNISMSETDDIENNISKYINSKSKNKIVGMLGKIAVSKLYGFSVEYIYSKKRSFVDFSEYGKNFIVKSTAFMRSEVVLLDSQDVEDDRGAHIFIGVNVDFDVENIYQTLAYVTGWITKQSFRKKCYYAQDFKGNLLFVQMAALSAPKGLFQYLKMLNKARKS